jgi:toxin-antitoxin system PIN domain toxin
MPAFTTSFLFPDVNVWVALTHGRHVHHLAANDWLDSLPADIRLCFCRFTQLAFLRLLTAEAVMGDDVLDQRAAWVVYDRWLAKEHVTFLAEPDGVDRRFRELTRSSRSSPQSWADAYLAAFATVSELTLVTFDRGFKGRVKPLLLLGE